MTKFQGVERVELLVDMGRRIEEMLAIDVDEAEPTPGLVEALGKIAVALTDLADVVIATAADHNQRIGALEDSPPPAAGPAVGRHRVHGHLYLVSDPDGKAA